MKPHSQNKIAILALALVLCIASVQDLKAQVEYGNWLLKFNTAPTYTANVYAWNGDYGSGIYGIYYDGNGMGSKPWPSYGSPDPTKYLLFMIAPNAGYSFTATSISGTFWMSGSGSNNPTGKMQYSLYNNFSSPVDIGTPFSLGTSEVTSTFAPLFIEIPTGQYLYVRFYGYGIGSSSDFYFCRNFNISGFTTGLATGALPVSAFCAGSTVSVPYTVSGSYNPGNVFTAQLSGSTGSFTSPTVIGSVSSTGAGTINATIPAGTSPGTGYRIRVVSSSPSVTGTNNGSDLAVTIPPTYSVTPADVTCFAGSNGQITVTASGGTGPWYYSVNNGSGYIYDASNPHVFTGLAPGTYKIRVKDSNGCESANCP
jgi:hypothetical protein